MAFELFTNSTSVNILGKDTAVESLIIGAMIMIGGIIIARIVGMVFRRYLSANIPESTSKTAYKLVYYGIIVITLLAVITSQGIDLSGLMVAGGIFGIIIGFATQSVVSNLISGIFLMFDRPAKPGDLIEITGSGNVYGKLMDITVFSTRIMLFDGSIMRVPNEKIFTSEIRNVSGSAIRRVDITFGVAYDENLDHVIGIIKKSLEEMPYVLREPEPTVWTEMGESNINLKVLTWTPRDEWNNVGPILLRVIKKSLDEEGIKIPFPQRTIHYVENAKQNTVKSTESYEKS